MSDAVAQLRDRIAKLQAEIAVAEARIATLEASPAYALAEYLHTTLCAHPRGGRVPPCDWYDEEQWPTTGLPRSVDRREYLAAANTLLSVLTVNQAKRFVDVLATIARIGGRP